MTDEVQALAEVDSAQAPEVTATTDNAQNAPVVAENQDGSTQEEKKYSQAEIDAMIGKRLAREQRKWEREQQAKQARFVGVLGRVMVLLNDPRCLVTSSMSPIE